jgi:hypothetical protein
MHALGAMKSKTMKKPGDEPSLFAFQERIWFAFETHCPRLYSADCISSKFIRMTSSTNNTSKSS